MHVLCYLFVNVQGKIQLISQSGVHQLHIFIFLLGVFHILYSVIGMALAQAKVCYDCYSCKLFYSEEKNIRDILLISNSNFLLLRFG